MGILSGMSISGGIVGIVWDAVSPTEFNFLGVTLTTGHVGVAFAALGLGFRSLGRKIGKDPRWRPLAERLHDLLQHDGGLAIEQAVGLRLTFPSGVVIAHSVT